MSGFNDATKLLKGGIVVANPRTLAVERTVVLQYNPAKLTRKLTSKSSSGEQTDRSEALRLSGPAVETISLEAEIDAVDQLDAGNPIPAALGVQPQLAALQNIVNPSVEQVLQSAALEDAGFMEILPMESPLTLFVWSRRRILPVRVTEFSISEEMFDNALNPIRAKLTLGMRVLSFDDLGFKHKGGSLSVGHMIQQELLAAFGGFGNVDKLGVGDLL